MCVLSEVYRFIASGEKGMCAFSDALKSELYVCQGLVFLTVADLSREPNRKVYCSDASQPGYALRVTDAEARDVALAACWRERWRFVEAVPASFCDHT